MISTKPRSFKLSLLLFILFMVTCIIPIASAQTVAVKEKKLTIKTYPYSDPDPVATRGIQKHIYPYFRFDGYSHTGRDMEWTVVSLENPYIKLFVLPEVGGKIWGAIEKSTGKEFIYLNSVLKFRDIAMRGAWTSGGIEFNFGLIGHHPMTSSPVDYTIMNNRDGSKTCVVGAIDLPSRTQWRVFITLHPDRAYFETKCLWYNPTSFHTSYYHWMNGAFKASNDFKLYFPGKYTIGHGGLARDWSIDARGRDLSIYGNNNFGPSKSYHVLGEYAEFSGGYWQNSDFGFGHHAFYDDLPGKKNWIWSLSRSGAIWENLLTDTDGQYVEVQMGRLFNQANLTSGFRSPFTQVPFSPITTDQWEEIWFPVKEIGGLKSASEFGVMNVTQGRDSLAININALQAIDDRLIISAGGKQVYSAPIHLQPMDVFTKTIDFPFQEQSFDISLGNGKLHYSSDRTANILERPIRSAKQWDDSTAEKLFQRAEEYFNTRQLENALKWYTACLAIEPVHSRALTRVAEIHCQRGEYNQALKYVTAALSQNTYNPDANFIFGVIQRQQGDLINAREAFGWAARAMQYRSAAYTQIAEIYVQEKNFERAEIYARKALDYDRYNVQAHQALAIAYRKQARIDNSLQTVARILEIDPLDHFARYERYLVSPDRKNLDNFRAMIRNEFPHESYLEIALYYVSLNLENDATLLLKKAPAHPTVCYWLAYLLKEKSTTESNSYLQKAVALSPRLVFPFRLETIPVLQYAIKQQPHWKTNYYLGLIYWSKGRLNEAVTLFEQCENSPDFAAFYLSRGNLFAQAGKGDGMKDFKTALGLDDDDWRAWLKVGEAYMDRLEVKKALEILAKAHARFPDNFIIGMAHANALLSNERYEQCIAVLENLQVLPAEGAREAHTIFENAHLFYALKNIKQGHYKKAIQSLEQSKTYPEHLGVGAPYNYDTRLQDYMMARCYQQLGDAEQADLLFGAINKYTIQHWTDRGWNHFIGALVLRQSGEEDKAQQLLEDWTKPQKTDFSAVQKRKNSFAEWSKAKFYNDRDKIQSIEKQVSEASKMKRPIDSGLATLIKVMEVFGE